MIFLAGHSHTQPIWIISANQATLSGWGQPLNFMHCGAFFERIHTTNSQLECLTCKFCIDYRSQLADTTSTYIWSVDMALWVSWIIWIYGCCTRIMSGTAHVHCCMSFSHCQFGHNMCGLHLFVSNYHTISLCLSHSLLTFRCELRCSRKRNVFFSRSLIDEWSLAQKLQMLATVRWKWSTLHFNVKFL